MRDWTAEQLGKWRIRKAHPDDRPPWWPKAQLVLSGRDPHPWWVYEPGEPGPSACWGTHDAALEHVNGLICHRITGPYVARADQQGGVA